METGENIMMGAGDFSIGSKVWPGVSKLIEEMGELNQVLGKLIAMKGLVDHWDGTDLAERLIEEIADVHAALGFVVAVNELPFNRIHNRSRDKNDLFWKWQKGEVNE